MPRFGRILTAMVTPFDAQGDLNVDAAVHLAKWLVEQGNEGLVICGTTGESPTLSIDEKLTLFETVASAVTVPILAGTTGYNTGLDIGLTEEAGKLGIAGVLAVCPFYSRPSQAGLETHFRAIAGATDLPVVLYDIPVRSGRKIDSTTLVRLAADVPFTCRPWPNGVRPVRIEACAGSVWGTCEKACVARTPRAARPSMDGVRPPAWP